MLTAPPGFFEDVGRHGLGAAFSKRFSSFTVQGLTVTYDALRAMPWDRLTWMFGQAALEGRPLVSAWAYEAMLLQSGRMETAWQAALWALQNVDEPRALAALEHLLRYPGADESLAAHDHGLWGNYLLGKVFSDRARKASTTTAHESSKAAALQLLDRSRQQIAAQQRQPAADPYRQAAQLAAVAATVAAAYEATQYLQHTAAASSSTSDSSTSSSE